MCFILRQISFACGCAISGDGRPLALCTDKCAHWNGRLEQTCEPKLNGRTWKEWPDCVPRFPQIFCAAHQELFQRGRNLEELPPTIYSSLDSWVNSGAFINNNEYSRTLTQIQLEVDMLKAQNALVSNKVRLDIQQGRVPTEESTSSSSGESTEDLCSSLKEQINAEMYEWRALCRGE